MNRTILLFFALTLFSQTYAQTFISTAMPTNTIGAGTAGLGTLNLETEFRAFDFATDDRRMDLPVAMVRYGVQDKVDVYAFMNYSQSYLLKDGEEVRNHGFNGVRIGTKYNFLKAEDKKPALSVDLSTGLPFVGKEALNANFFSTQAVFIVKENLTDKISLTGNIGSRLDLNETDELLVNGLYTLQTGVVFSERFWGFAELFGQVGGWKFDDITTNIAAGVGYKVFYNTQFTLSASTSINDAIGEHYYISLGVAQRLITGK